MILYKYMKYNRMFFLVTFYFSLSQTLDGFLSSIRKWLAYYFPLHFRGVNIFT